jgi:hypothetical protein
MPSVYIAKDDGVALLDFDLKPGRSYTIGRSSTAEVRLEAQSISRLHALLYDHGGTWKITDLGSTKGLRTKEGVVKHKTLANGDWVAVGPAVIWFFDENEEQETSLGMGAMDAALDTDDIRPSEQEHRELALLHIRHRDNEQETLIGLTRKSLLIGADAHCDIQIEGIGVEGLHCLVFRSGKAWLVTTSEDEQIMDTTGMPSACAELDDKKTLMIGPLELRLSEALIPRKLDPGQDQSRRAEGAKKPRDPFDLDLS